MRAFDTSAAAAEVQNEVLRKMSPARRFALAWELSETTRRITADGIASRHPSYSKTEVAFALRRMLLGDEIFQKAWPKAPLLAP